MIYREKYLSEIRGFYHSDADRQIVGNFLYSEWRYYTHWALPGEYDPYITDYLQRVIRILESKYEAEGSPG